MEYLNGNWSFENKVIELNVGAYVRILTLEELIFIKKKIEINLEAYAKNGVSDIQIEAYNKQRAEDAYNEDKQRAK